MKLFTIPITTGPHAGKELVGFDNADKYLKNNVILKPYWPMIGGFLNEFYPKYDPEIKVISTISDITEEQAQELGPEFETKYKWKQWLMLQSRIQQGLGKYESLIEYAEYSDMFNNILLILVTP